MPDIFDEVSEDLRAERAQRLLQRYGWLLVVVALAIVAAAGAWQYWRWHEAQARASVAASFMTAANAANTALGSAGAPPPAEATQTFADLAANGPTGYRTLARLREAALKAGTDLPAALAIWDKVSADETADPQLRRLADLLWVQHQVDSGDPATVEGRLAPLLAPGNLWRPLAQECQALLKLRTGDKAGAITILRDIVAQPMTPNGVRSRASGLLVRLGELPEPPPTPDKQG